MKHLRRALFVLAALLSGVLVYRGGAPVLVLVAGIAAWSVAAAPGARRPARALGALLFAALAGLTWISYDRHVGRAPWSHELLRLGACPDTGRLAAPMHDCAFDPRPRDLILISIDTLRRDLLGLAGHPTRPSPAIDAFVADAIHVERAYATASWTLPSLASLMSGEYSSRHGGTRSPTSGAPPTRIDPEVPLLAEHLSRVGYATGAFVDAAMPLRALGLLEGFERISDDAGPPDPDAVGDWLDSLPRGPAFLWVHYLDPHTPYAPAARFLEDPGALDASVAIRNLADLDVCPELTATELDLARQLYRGEIRQVDDRIGRLLERLHASPRWSDAIVVLTSDHGEELYEHDSCGHGQSLYDELVRVLLAVRVPGRPPAVVATPMSQVDLPASLLALLGLDGNAGDAGRDRSGVLLGCTEGGAVDPTTGDVFVVDSGMAALIQGDLKVVRDRGSRLRKASHGERPEVYDLARDPGERSDLFHPRRHDELVTRLECFRSAWGERSAPTIAADLSDAELEQLRQLGYLAD